MLKDGVCEDCSGAVQIACFGDYGSRLEAEGALTARVDLLFLRDEKAKNWGPFSLLRASSRDSALLPDVTRSLGLSLDPVKIRIDWSPEATRRSMPCCDIGSATHTEREHSKVKTHALQIVKRMLESKGPTNPARFRRGKRCTRSGSSTVM